MIMLINFRYASTVMDLSNINKDLNEHIKTIQEFTQEVSFIDCNSEVMKLSPYFIVIVIYAKICI